MATFHEASRALLSVGLISHPFTLSSNSSTSPPLFPLVGTPVISGTPFGRFPTLLPSEYYSQNYTIYVDSVVRRFQNLRFRIGYDPRRSSGSRKKVVVLGTGWGGMNFITRIDVAKYDVTIISPRNYFAFTPLLPSVASGTLSPRSCLEPVRDKLMRGGKKVMEFHEAWATDINTETVRV